MLAMCDVVQYLMKATEHKWSLQGFGMLRLYVSKRERLHVWHSQYRTENVTLLHTHPWHFTSEVFSGWIRNQIYQPVETPFIYNYGSKVPLYQRQSIVCGPGGCAIGEKKNVYLRKLSEQTYMRGERYSHLAEEIHSTEYGDGTVTLITRTFLEDTEHAYVYIPDKEEWVSAEPREATKEEVEAITGYALSKLREEFLDTKSNRAMIELIDGH
jgi:hypothetical protein